MDIGAHIGYMTIIGAHIAGRSGTVRAIEPVPANADATRRNARINGFAHVRVVEAAASRTLAKKTSSLPPTRSGRALRASVTIHTHAAVPLCGPSQ